MLVDLLVGCLVREKLNMLVAKLQMLRGCSFEDTGSKLLVDRQGLVERLSKDC